jgi:hypothetical protein
LWYSQDIRGKTLTGPKEEEEEEEEESKLLL